MDDGEEWTVPIPFEDKKFRAYHKLARENHALALALVMRKEDIHARKFVRHCKTPINQAHPPPPPRIKIPTAIKVAAVLVAIIVPITLAGIDYLLRGF